MPPESSQAASSIEDYLDLFETLAGLGMEFVVIGGCVVGAYARLMGEEVLSADLDLLVTWRTLEAIVADGGVLALVVQKMPEPRTVPVALLEWRGREINLLTGSTGLPSPDVAARAAREFQLGAGTHARVLIADPFDLLRNKLAVNRPKDQAHIAILRRFLDEEAVRGMAEEEEPRARISAAERLLEVLGAQTLDEALATRLLPLARTPADFRFLARRAPVSLVERLVASAPSGALREAVERIARHRGITR
jgi:hypothetical protein